MDNQTHEAFANKLQCNGVPEDRLITPEVNKLLKDVQGYSRSSPSDIDQIQKKFVSVIEELPPKKFDTLDEANQIIFEESEVVIPFPECRPKEGALPALRFAKPSATHFLENIVQTATTKDLGQDNHELVLIMPPDLFQKADYMDYRYYYKRAFYLACIASGLIKHKEMKMNFKFCYQNGSPLQPVISAFPTTDCDEKSTIPSYRVTIICTIASGFFPAENLRPWQSCIESHKLVWPGKAPEPTATPVYNATLSSESSIVTQHEILKATQADTTGFQPACILLALWLRQRGYETGLHDGGFGAIEVCLLLALMLRSKVLINRQHLCELRKELGALQLFRQVIKFLADFDLMQSPAVVQGNPNMANRLAKGYVPTFFDGKSGLNLLYKMSQSSYEKLRYQARTTIACLDQMSFNSLVPTFTLRTVSPWLQYDQWIRLGRMATSTKIPLPYDANTKVSKLCETVFSILRTALGDRVALVHVWTESPGSWELMSSAPAFKSPAICIGLNLHPQNARRTVDRGPLECDREANAFRDFWGAKTELRRFKDGSIREGLVWSKNQQDGHPTRQIIAYVLSKHLGQNIEDVIGDNTDFDGDDHAVKDVQHLALEELQQVITRLPGLPLQVRQMRIAVPRCRFEESVLRPTINRGLRKRAISVIMQFEGSSRWPDDFSAVQRTKAAMLLKLADATAKALPHTRSRLGIDRKSHRWLDSPFLDMDSELAVFRIRLHHEKEPGLLEQIANSPTSSSQIKEAAAAALSSYKRIHVFRPAHAEAMDSLATKNPALNLSVKLFRRWCAAHLLLNHIRKEIIETLVALVFTSPHPYAVPASPQTGFLRTLARVAQWDWQREPLMVELGAKLSSTEIKTVQLRFEAWRTIDPSMNRVTLFVATPMDLGGIAWTEAKVPRVVAARLTALAQASIAKIDDEAFNPKAAALFTTPLHHYDFLIRLRSANDACSMVSHLRTWHQVVSEGIGLDILDCDLVQDFVMDLNIQYREVAIFLYGEQNSTIGGLWLPFKAPRKWRANVEYSTVAIKAPGGQRSSTTTREDAQMDASRAAVLNEIARLGKDVISIIEPQGAV